MPSRNLKKAVLVSIGLMLPASSAFGGNWNEHQRSLAHFSRKLESKEQEVKRLLQEKQNTHDEKKIKQIIREIAGVYKEIEKASADYEEERQHVRFEHPRRSDALKRTYTRHRLQSLDEMDKGIGIDASLDRAKTRVMTTFVVPEREVESPRPKISVGPRKPASVTDEEDMVEKVTLKK